MNSLFKCLHCGGLGLAEQHDALACNSCGRQYPIVFGVPLLLKGISRRESGFRLTDDLAREICRLAWLDATEANCAALKQIFAYNYDLPNSTLAAENNYYLHRVGITSEQKRPTFKDRFPGAPVNKRIRYCFDDDYVPSRLPCNKGISKNVRIRNTGTSIISSTGSRPAFISYHWRDARGQIVHWDGRTTPLPIDLYPGHALTVPMVIDTLPAEGLFFLELTLQQDDGSWHNNQSAMIGVELSREAHDAWPADWVETGTRHASYDEDHHAGGQLLKQELERRGRAGLRILEIGGCSLPMSEALRLPHEIYNVDIDVQTLQVGTLRRPLTATRTRSLCGDGNELPFVDGSFDWIVMFSTLHHFVEPVAMLRKLKRLLKDDGFLAVMCEPIGHYHHGQAGDILIEELEQGINEQTFTLEEYHYMFEQAGLQAERGIADVGSFKAILRPGPEVRRNRPAFRGRKRALSFKHRLARWLEARRARAG